MTARDPEKVSFNLIDEAWIPCIPLTGGLPRELSLREALARAHELREISDLSPLVTVALHRLLLAVVHRVCRPAGAPAGPADARAWSELWRRGRWDEGALDQYLDEWHARFDLFDTEYPFYQCKSLATAEPSPISLLLHDRASGNNATLFDHTLDESPPELRPAQAARALLAHQSFAVGGLVSLLPGEDARTHKSADAAPLVKGAVALCRGQTLFETLMLNLHRYSPADEQPFACRADDLPAWEWEVETQPEDRHPRGYLDVLTWQSRRVHLRPAVNGAGQLVVRHAVNMKGWQFPNPSILKTVETMMAFRANPKAGKGQDPFPPVGFRPDRALWRDSLALVEVSGAESARPKTFDWLSVLVDAEVLEYGRTVPVDFLGLSTDKAKVLLWRHERLPLPLAYLEDKDLRDDLREGLKVAEEAGQILRQTAWRLAQRLAAPLGQAMPREHLEPIYESLGVERLYWWRLEVPFKVLLTDLAREHQNDAASDGVEESLAMREWCRAVYRAAVAAFEEAARGLDVSARTLQAVAAVEPAFRGRLFGLMKEHLGQGIGGSQ
jgi:CRISPR system Cascade subunit CasA